jgi:hypothetical protein
MPISLPKRERRSVLVPDPATAAPNAVSVQRVIAMARPVKRAADKIS